MVVTSFPLTRQGFTPFSLPGFFYGKINGKTLESLCSCALNRRIKNRIKPRFATLRVHIHSLSGAFEQTPEVT